MSSTVTGTEDINLNETTSHGEEGELLLSGRFMIAFLIYSSCPLLEAAVPYQVSKGVAFCFPNFPLLDRKELKRWARQEGVMSCKV